MGCSRSKQQHPPIDVKSAPATEPRSVNVTAATGAAVLTKPAAAVAASTGGNKPISYDVVDEKNGVTYISSKSLLHMQLMPTAGPELVIPIDGNICSGKSTILEMTGGKLIGGKRIYGIMEEINQTLLKLYVDDPKKWAAMLQLDTIARCHTVLEKAKYTLQQDTIALVDRSPAGNMAFATALLLDGMLDREQWNVYTELCRMKNFESIMSDNVSAFIYIHSTPDLCHERVQKRIGTVDTGYMNDYLCDIDTTHFMILLWWSMKQTILTEWTTRHYPPVHVLDWRNFGDFYEKLKSLHMGAKRVKGIKGQSFQVRMWPRRYVNLKSEKEPESVEEYAARTNSTILTFDADDDVESIPKDRFKAWTDANSRYRPTQSWKNRFVELASAGKNIILHRTKPKQGHMLDLFCSLPESLSLWK